MGKGSSTRPSNITQEEYKLRYQIIWGSDEEKEEARKRLEELLSKET